MFIRSNKITYIDIQREFDVAREDYDQDARYEYVRGFTPRKFKIGHQIYGYSYYGKRASAHDRDEKAMSWEAWGYVIAYLFHIDPNAQIGFYKDSVMFRSWCVNDKRYSRDICGAFLDLI